jgi:hypothetical protein
MNPGLHNSGFNSEDGGSTVLRNVTIQPPHYTAQQPKKATTVETSNLASPTRLKFFSVMAVPTLFNGNEA